MSEQSECSWVSAHLFYHGDQDAVIAGVVKPAVERLGLAGLAEGFFFLRYWEGGPHVRLRVRTRPEQAQEVRSVIEETAAEFYRALPSQTALTEQEYAESAPALAEVEGMDEYDTVLHPDNSLAFIDYVPQTDVFGTGRALEAVEQQLMASSVLAVELITRGRTAGQRAMDAFAMMAANRTVFTGILPELAYQARFMVEGSGPGAELLQSAEFERTFEANKAPLRSSLEAVFASTRGVALPEASVPSRWLTTVRDVNDTLVKLELLGELDSYPDFEAPADVLQHINHLVPQLIVERCMHLMCNRLGISLAQESHLRALLTRTAFDLCAV
ncbi:lantibiotic dehydratase C-terminal domain-containing protein [Kitasatospora viridis]|uniref:Thiopeptide-type bacteriocin biosynthesis protein n=1 Tax=Kitasatospora viridis TaxID=281105 RepID=A0A561TVM9_9ACTN|nr:lantibiotic dehydratase C-terminal domain-containing protein [Kitasatospora viridis]TWF91167.1 thiopeptide-type bacteriocin biosynthesis protein [Kitasatospora viridis]